MNTINVIGNADKIDKSGRMSYNIITSLLHEDKIDFSESMGFRLVVILP